MEDNEQIRSDCQDLLLRYPIPIANPTIWRCRRAGPDLQRPRSAGALGRSTISLIDVFTQGSRAKATGDLVKKLLAQKASITERAGRTYRTPLHAAARLGSVEACRVILDVAASTAGRRSKGCKKVEDVLEAQDRLGLTPLMDAAAEGHQTVVEELVKRRAEIGRKSSAGSTAVDWARGNDQLAVADFLSERLAQETDLRCAAGKVNDPKQWSALMQAAHENDIRGIEHAVSRGLKPRTPGLLGDTALHVASRKGNAPAVTSLIAAKAFINLKNDIKLTPLGCAVCAGHTKVVELLIDAMANVEPGDKLLAERREDFDILDMLTKAHARKTWRSTKFKIAFMQPGLSRGPSVESGESEGDQSPAQRRRHESCAKKDNQKEDNNIALLKEFLTFIKQKVPANDNSDKNDRSTIGRGKSLVRRVSVEYSSIYDLLRRTFELFDDNANLEVSALEFRMGMERLGYKGNSNTLFKILDQNGNGTITVDEISEAAETLAFAESD